MGLRSGAHASRSIETPWPTPTHMVAIARLAPVRASSRAAVPTIRAPLMPSGWPSAIAPPFALTRGVVILERKFAQNGERLRREGFIQLDDVDVVDREVGSSKQLSRRRHGADPHHRRGDARSGQVSRRDLFRSDRPIILRQLTCRGVLQRPPANFRPGPDYRPPHGPRPGSRRNRPPRHSRDCAGR